MPSLFSPDYVAADLDDLAAQLKDTRRISPPAAAAAALAVAIAGAILAGKRR